MDEKINTKKMVNRNFIIVGILIILIMLGILATLLFQYNKNKILNEERNNLCYLSNNLIDGINSDSYLLYQINPILVENRTMLNKINCSERLQ
jgi:hypothetical protein